MCLRRRDPTIKKKLDQSLLNNVMALNLHVEE